jgi:hypothetical protein
VAADHLGGCDFEATANLRRQRVSQPVWRPAFNVVPFPPRWIARQKLPVLLCSLGFRLGLALPFEPHRFPLGRRSLALNSWLAQSCDAHCAENHRV